MADVFISYKCDINQRHAKELHTVLAELSVDSWYAEIDEALYRRQTSSEAIKLEISELVEKQQSDAKVVVVLWSRASVTSDWVYDEAKDAQEAGNLIEVLIDDVGVDDLRKPFKHSHKVNLRNWDLQSQNKTWRGFLNILGTKIERAGLEELFVAIQSNSLQEKEAWARKTPNDPMAASIWKESEAERDAEFQTLLSSFETKRTVLLPLIIHELLAMQIGRTDLAA